MAGARGRGRGRGGGPRSVSQQYLQNSANEAGLDIKNVGRSAVGIFPDLELHSNGERRLLEHESDLLKEKRNGGVKIVGGSGATEAAAAAANTNGEDTTKVKQESNTSTSSTTTQDDTSSSSSSKPKSPKTIYLISKSREMHHKFQNSVFYIRGSTKEVPDVERFSDRLRPPSNNIDASDVLNHCLGGKKRTRGVGGGVYVPEELCGGQRRSIANIHDGEDSTKKIKGGLTIAELAAKEGGMDNEDDQKPSGAGDDDDIIGDDMPVEDEEDSDGADYTQNYYESDQSGGGSDGGEPTY